MENQASRSWLLCEKKRDGEREKRKEGRGIISSGPNKRGPTFRTSLAFFGSSRSYDQVGKEFHRFPALTAATLLDRADPRIFMCRHRSNRDYQLPALLTEASYMRRLPLGRLPPAELQLLASRRAP